MVDTLNLYKGTELVKSANRGSDGKGKIELSLAAGTKATKGEYKVAWSDGTSESEKVDVPAFEVPAPTTTTTTTKPTTTTTTTTPTTTTTTSPTTTTTTTAATTTTTTTPTTTTTTTTPTTTTTTSTTTTTTTKADG